MNMKKLRCLAGGIAILTAGAANAASVYVQTDVSSVPAGGFFTATVIADFTAEGGFTDGGFDLSWDTSILSLVTGTNAVAAELQAAFDTFDLNNPTAPPFPAHYNELLDTVTNPALLQFVLTNCGLDILAGATVCESIGASNHVHLYDLTFQVSATATVGVAAPTLLGSQWRNDNPDGSSGPLGDIIPTYTGATVTVSAIPVPPAIWLFGSGLLGLVGVARRRITKITA